MRDELGCGYPPFREEETEGAGWRPDDDDTWRSPAWFVRHKKPAFSLRYGAINTDFDWCPRWHWKFDNATIDGENVYVSLMRAHRWFEAGQLADYIAPPWTPALFEGLDMIAALEAERLRVAMKRKPEAEPGPEARDE